VVVRAELVHRDGRLARFDVVAEDSRGTVVGRAEVTRVVVDADRFLARLAR
jgi:predicted thioesterase